MFLAEPQRTAYDINFQVFGFPVRIHPLFWLMSFLISYGGGGGPPDPFEILTCVSVIFVSILIHELGHAIMFRKYGEAAHIVLYWMGGLAVPGDDAPHSSWSSYGNSSFGRRGHTPAERIQISFAGPAAGFILAALVIAGVYAFGGAVRPTLGPYYLPGWTIELGENMEGNRNLLVLIHYLLQINIWWGVMNLLPVFPLDGGQIALQVLTVSDPWGGTERALWLSIVVGVAAAALGGFLFQSLFVAIMFLSLAASNYFTLQQLRDGGGGGRGW